MEPVPRPGPRLRAADTLSSKGHPGPEKPGVGGCVLSERSLSWLSSANPFGGLKKLQVRRLMLVKDLISFRLSKRKLHDLVLDWLGDLDLGSVPEMHLGGELCWGMWVWKVPHPICPRGLGRGRGVSHEAGGQS